MQCQLCQRKVQLFVDGKTKTGQWADMCLPCHTKNGIGLGTGKGQKYREIAGVREKCQDQTNNAKPAISIDDILFG